jgi:dTDP-glucose pyrophosphorylase
MVSQKSHVVIPAAGLGTRMLPTSARIPKAMIPLKEKPVISWILDELLEQGFTDFTIIVGHLKHLLIDYVTRYYAGREGVRIEFVEQTQLDGVASAVGLAEPFVKTKDMLVVLGDTVFHDDVANLPKDRSLIMYGLVNDQWRWCLVELDEQHKVTGYVDKPDGPVATNKALVGIYYLHDAQGFFDAVKDIKARDVRIKNEFQLSSAFEVYSATRPMYGREVAHWYDCGSKDTFQQTKKSMLVQPRAFNTLEVENNTITKRSKSKRKFIDEITWFVSLPKKLRPYAPTVIDYNLDPDDAFITLEYVPAPTLSELFLYENLHVDMWKKVFRNLLGTMNKQFRPSKAHESPDWQADFRTHYLEKTFQRIEDVKECTDFVEMFAYGKVVVNGETLVPFKDLFKRVADQLWDKIAREEDISLLHGDMCFSNILYDVDGGSFKLIDPRGSFGKMKLHGDYKYDLAKMMHSVCGQYDFITHDLFKIAHDENRFDLTVYSAPEHKAIGEAFKQILKEEMDVDLDVVEFIEAILFFSMLPLHADHPKRMKAFFCIATKKLNDVAKRVLSAEEMATLSADKRRAA